MKRFFVVLLVLGGVSAGLAAAFFFGVGYYLSPQDPLAKSDAIVAISGGETDARTAEAIKLYKDGLSPVIIFSGAAADPNGPSNAQTMARTAIAAGVPPTAVFLDELATNTRGQRGRSRQNRCQREHPLDHPRNVTLPSAARQFDLPARARAEFSDHQSFIFRRAVAAVTLVGNGRKPGDHL